MFAQDQSAPVSAIPGLAFSGGTDGHLRAYDVKTGKLLWKDNSPGKNIMHSQWSSPSYADDPVPQVIHGQGDGWLRAFDPATGKLLWKFDGNPKNSVYELGGTGTKNDFVNVAPVVAAGRVFIGLGQDPEHSSGIGHLWCIDLKKAVETGFAFAPWCGSGDCEAKIKEETRATMRCIPFDQPETSGNCVACGKPAPESAIFARAY